MDSLSQLVLGAATVEAVMGKKVGNRAILWGAIGGTIPDLDVAFGPWMTDLQKIDLHRGFSHSLIFFVLLAPILGWLIAKIYKGKWGTTRQWAWAMFLAFSTHAILDCFTTWGTQLFWPFQHRVAWHTVFVADPLYTVPFLIIVIAVMFFKRTNNKRQFLNWFGIAISTGYLALTCVHKSIVNGAAQTAFEAQGIDIEHYETRPTPLNSILWGITAKSGEGYYFAYYSILDDLPAEEIKFEYVQQNDELLNDFRPNDDLDQMLFLTQGFYSVEKKGDDVLLKDLRFGEPVSLDGGEEGFVFGHYLEQDTTGNITFTAIPPPDISADEGERMISMIWNRMKGI